MGKVLTYDEFMALALKNYTQGGDGYYECWDKKMFYEYQAEFGAITKTKALEMFKLSKSIYDDMAGWF